MSSNQMPIEQRFLHVSMQDAFWRVKKFVHWGLSVYAVHLIPPPHHTPRLSRKTKLSWPPLPVQCSFEELRCIFWSFLELSSRCCWCCPWPSRTPPPHCATRGCPKNLRLMSHMSPRKNSINKFTSVNSTTPLCNMWLPQKPPATVAHVTYEQF